MANLFIIEHPRRGVLATWEGESFHFTWVGGRDDPNYSHIFFSAMEAARILRSMPPRIRKGCDIMMRPSGKIDWVKL